ncbi:MAG: polyamine aminopropyltransferase [FCB group bacterium]|nr:polyamine aminopropyltransferase [FCB group bacterium]
MAEEKKLNETYIQEEGMADLWNVWYSELHNGQSGLTLKIERYIESKQSDFQRIDVIENKDFGKLLVLYGSLMVCDNDNNSYNEMITHIPLFSHPSPEEVLIIGGGDCGALTEVLKHPEVKHCTMCEIDKMVVETAQRHFPQLTKGTDDPRAKIIYQDGKAFIENEEKLYDIIILDLSDPIGPAADLFQKKFHRTIYEHLKEDGILVTQTESPYYNKKTVHSLFKNLREIFPIVKMYICFMPIYPSGLWSFGFCSKKYNPIKNYDEKRYQKLHLNTQYYNNDVHKAAFSLPQFIKKLLE